MARTHASLLSSRAAYSEGSTGTQGEADSVDLIIGVLVSGAVVAAVIVFSVIYIKRRRSSNYNTYKMRAAGSFIFAV
jgi:heme/copper-type cytochrome/quinol oxidase subunit 2